MENDSLKSTNKHFSKLGFMFLAGTVLVMGLQYAVSYGFYFLAPSFANEHSTAYFLIMMFSMYLISMPLMALCIKQVPKAAPVEKKKMGFGKWVQAFLITYAAMYASNLIGTAITQFISIIKGAPVVNEIMEVATTNNMWVNFLVMVICAPIAEELLFRKMLIDRTEAYGDGVAIITTALFFGLFHGNLNQFAYAFCIGAVFGYVYLKTHNIVYTILMHMVINFMGGILSVSLLKYSGLDGLLSGNITSNEEMLAVLTSNIPGLILFAIYIFVVIAFALSGLAFFAANVKKLSFNKTELTVPKGQRFKTYFVNAGMIIFAVVWIARIIYQLTI